MAAVGRPSKGTRIRLNVRLPLACYVAFVTKAHRSGLTLTDAAEAALTHWIEDDDGAGS